MKNKITSIKSLINIVKRKKKEKKKIVLCHGVFDLLHIGHIKHFQQAKEYGDILIVTLTPDKFVNKGPGRPAFNEKFRLEALSSLNIVDYVGLNISSSAEDLIKTIKPNFYCKGPDYINHDNDISQKIKKEVQAIKSVNGKMIYTDGITFSSSNLLNRFSNTAINSKKILIKKIKKNYSFFQIRKVIENFKKTKILIIGETIIDKYIFCEALGKSGKEPVLVLKDLKSEEYLGGATALARHVSPFCEKISMLSALGEKEEYLSQIKKKLPKNITFKYIRKKNSPTILKRRFVDNVTKNKVLGVYSINDDVLSKTEDEKFLGFLKKMIHKFDLVIVSDYGHGLISKKVSKFICKNSKYLALNAQINAANRGYHGMRNYSNIQCVIINENEIRHDLRDKNSKIEILMKKLSQGQKIKNLVVTRGIEGAILYSSNDKKFFYSEAYSKIAVDKIGAGDAMLSIISLCLKNKLSKDLSLLIGSLAGAQSVSSIGNKEAISKFKILKSLEHILK